MTVRGAIASGSCSTILVRGLSIQIIRELNTVAAGSLIAVADQHLHADRVVLAFLQATPRQSLLHVLAERPGVTLVVRSMFRALPGQMMLWRQYREGRCGVTLAAEPANSPHELGAALDVAAPLDWKPAFLKHGWVYLGQVDRPHFQHMTDIRRDLGNLGVQAFQRLYNRFQPADVPRLAEDGVFGPQTEAALMTSPAAGWVAK